MTRGKRSASPAIDRLLVDLAGHFGQDIMAGTRVAETVRIGDLDVEVMLTVRQAATTRHETRNYRDQALALLIRRGYSDHCCASVRDRSPYRPYRAKKTKGCERTVTSALVSVTADKIRIDFACNQHARTECVGALILELSPNDLKAVRAARSQLVAIADTVYKQGERWGDDRPEIDAAIERVLARR